MRDRQRMRGAAAVAFVVIMCVVQVMMVGSVLVGARDQDLAGLRAQSMRAIYAAESGMNMALRELFDSTDHDGDGGVGSISDDADLTNDPAIGAAGARVSVTMMNGSSSTTIVSSGRCGSARRSAQAVLQ